jgi:hypothetical protein
MDDPTLPADATTPQLYDEISKTHVGSRGGSLGAGVPGALGSAGGTAIEFDTGFLSFGDRLAFTGTAAFTLEMWIRSTSTSFSHVITKQDRGTPKVGYAMYTNGGGLTYERYANSQAVNTSCTFPADGSYRHVAATYDANMLRLYVAGQLVGSSSDMRSMTPTTAPFLLGIESLGSTSFFQGSLDEVAIYDHALGADRIVAHVHAATAN